MPVIAVIGAQWGDEGKGKIVDLLSQQVKGVIRFSGGDNAGHTVINQYGEFKLHLVPSGIFNPASIAFLGNGMVINPAVLIAEIEELNQRGVDTSRLFISDRAHVVMPYHLMLDALEEEALAGKAVGTTRKGIGPAFVDKARLPSPRQKNNYRPRQNPNRLKLLGTYFGKSFPDFPPLAPESLRAGEREFFRNRRAGRFPQSNLRRWKYPSAGSG